MKIVALNCNNCGGPLEVPRKVQFFTCSYCSSHLKIEHSGGAIYSEILERLDQRTEQIVDELEAIKSERSIERSIEELDRNWEEQLKRYAVGGRPGEYNVPSALSAIFFSIWQIAFGILLFFIHSVTAGILVITFGAIVTLGATRQAIKFDKERRSYQSKRRRLMYQRSR